MKRYRSAAMVLLSVLSVLAGFGCTGTRQPATGASAPEASATVVQPGQRQVGFDVDDTLLLSSPAFDVASATEGVERGSPQFWTIVNSSDEGHSVVKQKALEILREHQRAGDEVYAVTARHADGGDQLRVFLERTFGIPGDHVYFETNGKAERLKALGIDIFYGDADTDMSAAIEAGAEPVRILRSPRSGYTRHYHPGSFDERIIEGSEE